LLWILLFHATWSARQVAKPI